MSDTIEQLYSRWLERETDALQKAAQALVQSDDPEAAFRAALNTEPAEPSDVLEAFADKVTPEPGPDGPYIEALGRRISRAEAQEVLARWNGPVSPFSPQGSLGEAMADALSAASDEWEASQARQKEERRATHDENLRSANANRIGQ